MGQAISGIHHVTAITSDAQKNVDFYCGVLGLRLVKVTVNFDDPKSYHLYYGDELGRPGSIMTFFAWPGARRGRPGPSQVTTTSFSVPAQSVGFWTNRLAHHGVQVAGTSTRFGDQIVEFSDPDGIQLELVATREDSRSPWAMGPVSIDNAIRGFHGVVLAEEGYEKTATLLTRTLGLNLVESEGNRFRYAVSGASAGSVVDLLCVPDSPRGSMGAGTVHHVAFRVPDDTSQQQWRDQLVAGHHNVSPVMDRNYFHSIYFREPGGVLFELATDGPGFTVDEPADSLGTALKLPSQYERARSEIQAFLPPLRPPKAGAP